MCLAIPAKIIKISKDGSSAKVDYGGVIRDVNIEMIDVTAGEYVLIHAGFAIEIMDKETALTNLKEIDNLLKVQEEMQE